MNDARDAVVTAILAVVATMEDCRKDGIPCIASSIYLALESRGVPGFSTLRAMATAGIVKYDGHLRVLEPGPKYEAVLASLKKAGLV